ncbi:MAG: type II toxin-antitoxin system RelE/ParE family toxin [Gemmataceae bacterium]|nr:type II toxin-antitoxin system RelE/ParE family toxin [Gemmataceae bacterium]
MSARLAPEALYDAIDAADWYEQQSPGLGTRFEAAVDALVLTLTAQPRLYPRVARAPRGREIREGPVPGFPFVAGYEVIGADVVVLSIDHARSIRRRWRRRLP